MNTIAAPRRVGWFFVAFMAGTAFALGAVSVAAAVADVNRPNVIVFFSDQQRWDTVGCYGQKLPLTPHLDRMAAEGVRFTYAFTSQPVCGPTRAVLQTGKYATRTGCFRNGIPLPTTERTIAPWFSEAGYEVGYIGKWHLASTNTKPVPPERRGGYKDFWLASDVREELKQLGLAENILLVYTSDHGCHFRTRNSEYKRACHDACTRIPLVACGPGFRDGKVVEDIVSLIDVPPTLLAAAGVPTAGSMQGRPLQGLLDGTAKDWPKEVSIQISESQVGRAIRTKKWKYSVRAPGLRGNRDSGSDEYVEDFLYDLDKDPHDRSNLVADPALGQVRAQLAERLKHRMAQAGEQVPRILPASQ